MALSVFPAPVVSTINANSITATTSNTLYEGTQTFEPAIYQITCVNTTNARVEFFSGAGDLIVNTTTVSGTVSINLGTLADRIRVFTDTGSDIVVTVTKIAAALTDSFSGTLDTITSTGTYTGTSTSGFGYVMAVGGGGGGAGNRSPNGSGGGGGGGGGVAGKVLALTGSMSVTVGALGALGASAGNGVAGSAGGNTTISTLTGNGGSGAATNTQNQGGSGGNGGNATGGTYNTTGNAGSTGVNAGNGFGGSAISAYPFAIVSASIGAGGQGSGNAGTGKGSGGAGGGISGHGNAYNGGNGTAGVIYVLRF